MLRRIIRNNLRRPLFSAAMLLFAAVMTVVLCYLHRSGAEEMNSYQKTYASVPVTFRVSDLDGSKPGHIQGWIADLFSDRGMKPNLEPFVGQLYTRVSMNGEYVVDIVYDEFGDPVEIKEPILVTGIASLYVAEELTEDWGGAVCWYEGYDESILSTDAQVCLVPESMKELKEVKIYYVHTYMINDTDSVTMRTNHTLTVAGYYIDKGNSRLYCPYPEMQQIHAQLGASKELEELCAVLNDNNLLPQLREIAAGWFAEPNPSGDQTPWGQYSYEYYLYALDIDDYMLRSLESNMKSSVRLNQLASVVVFILSAAAGFLTGFLVIRARKREVALMRTMGASQVEIFQELALEQMLCLLAGIFLGGALFLWRAVGRLALFAGIYFVGLSVALVIFLRKNLLTTIKEDE